MRFWFADMAHTQIPEADTTGDQGWWISPMEADGSGLVDPVELSFTGSVCPDAGTEGGTVMKKGWIKLHRSSETLELLKKPNEFSLYTMIAIRAKRTGDFNVHNLEVGEALIGDHQSCGLTQRQYRTAKKNLETWGVATFKATNKGTVARLLDTRIYNINIEQSDNPSDKQDDNPATSQRQASDKQGDKPATTNKKDKNIKNENNGKKEKEKRDVFPESDKGQFDQARKIYQGRKRGLDTEFKDFQKHRDWKEALLLLQPAIVKQTRHREELQKSGQWCPEWKNFKTWINQRCWEEVLPDAPSELDRIDQIMGTSDATEEDLRTRGLAV